MPAREEGEHVNGADETATMAQGSRWAQTREAVRCYCFEVVANDTRLSPRDIDLMCITLARQRSRQLRLVPRRSVRFSSGGTARFWPAVDTRLCIKARFMHECGEVFER